jgi:hypothetical protein
MTVRGNLIFVVLAAVLFCTVSVMEIPELLRLADDTSNDFSITDVREISAPAVEAQQRCADTVPFVVSTAPRFEPSAPVQSRKFDPLFDERLHSLCILRT